MRDCADNVVIVCSIENIDPMGVHTGDSVTVAPQQTLTDRLYQRLRDQAIAVIRAVGVETGGSNVQFAVNPADRGDPRDRDEPARVALLGAGVEGDRAFRSRRSPPAWRSATASRRSTTTSPASRPACFEPTIDYVVVKWPRFAFEKFPGTDPTLTTHMKSVGEAMAIGRTFRQAFAKALRSRELDKPPCSELGLDAELLSGLQIPGPDRYEAILELLRRGSDVEAIARAHRDRPVVPARAAGAGRRPATRRSPGERAFSSVDTCAAEFPARTPYYYSGWERRPSAGRRRRGRARGERRVGRDPRRRAQPHRSGHRVRLLLRARRDDRARVRPRRGDDQLQPRDRLDRLRHLRPPLLRAADAGGRARR